MSAEPTSEAPGSPAPEVLEAEEEELLELTLAPRREQASDAEDDEEGHGTDDSFQSADGGDATPRARHAEAAGG